jgi:hypothetical protein
MGLFTTVLHIYKTSQEKAIDELSNELQQNHGFTKLRRLDISNSNYEEVLEKEIFPKQGAFYLITKAHGNWTTIIELEVNLSQSLYLYEIVNELSERLDTYTLSFHLHDDDVLYYNLSNHGEALDGYNSDFQYFETEPLPKEEILSQRHSPEFFKEILPSNKNADKLNEILNEGMWAAFDNNDLDEDGVPKDDEKYYVNELERFERIGKYLEIFFDNDYPFANWYPNLVKLDLKNCYLLKSER